MAHLLDRISKRQNELSKAERKVAASVLAAPALTADETIAQTAERAGVSQPSVHRFCKSFGFEGFPDFKNALKESLTKETGHYTESIQSGDSVSDIVKKVQDASFSALTMLGRTLDLNVLSRSIDVIAQARRMVIAASALSLPYALEFKLKLLCSGIACEVYADETALLQALCSLQQGDLLSVFDLSGEDQKLLKAAGFARDNDSCVIALCPKGCALSELSSLALHSPPFDSGDDLRLGSAAPIHCLLEIIMCAVSLRRLDVKFQERLGKAKALIDPKREEPAPKTEPEPAQDADVLDPHRPITALNWPF